MYTYTLAFVFYKDQFLMLRRIKAPWLGMWNGLGGKIQEGETPLSSVTRELREEMDEDLSLATIEDAGFLTWNTFEAHGQGIHLYKVHLNKPFQMKYPQSTREGILDIKPLTVLMDKDNNEVATNIPYFIKAILERPHHVHCIFQDDTLQEVNLTPL